MASSSSFAPEACIPEAPATRSLPFRLSEEGALTATLVGRELGGPAAQASCAPRGGCALTRLVGAAHTVYLIRLRYKDRQWVIRRRYRELWQLNQGHVQDAELRAIFPPRSLCAKGGLACALETRQSRLAYYVNELAHKLPKERHRDEILRFLGAIAPRDRADGRRSLGAEEKVRSGTVEDGEAGGIRLSRLDLDGDGVEEEALDPESQRAFDRLRTALANGVTVIKHGRRGGPKRRLVFCDEGLSTLYWASDRRRGAPLSSLQLSAITEVREGTAPDPAHPGQTGTAVLRRRRSSLGMQLHPPQQHRSLSLITGARTLDLEAVSDGDYAMLLHGFRAACRWQEIQARQQEAQRQRQQQGQGQGQGQGKAEGDRGLVLTDHTCKKAVGRCGSGRKEQAHAQGAPPAFGGR